MQKQSLPRQVEARKLAAAMARIDACEPVSSFPRFVAGLDNDAGEVAIGLDFFRDEQKHYRISGTLATRVNVICQRCLQSMSIALDTSFEIGLVWSEEQAQALPKSLDTMVLAEEPLDLLALVDDELILGTPIVSYHELADCGMSTPMVFGDAPDRNQKIEEGERSENPFAVLEKLKSSDT